MASPVMDNYSRYLLPSSTKPLIDQITGQIDDQSLVDLPKDVLDRTPLHQAALSENCHEREFRCLLDGTTGLSIDAQDIHGDTPLHLVVKSGQPGKLPHLCEANIRVKNKKGDTALHVAAIRKDQYMIHKLCETFMSDNKNIDYENESGDSALHICARNGDAEGVRLLLQYGADLRCVNRHGDSVLHALAAEMVAWPDKITQLLNLYQTIVDNAALWWSKVERNPCPLSYTMKYVHTQRYAVLLLTSYIKNKDDLNVVHFATALGACKFLEAILNTERAYRFVLAEGPYDEPSYHYDVTNLAAETTSHSRGVRTIIITSTKSEQPLEVGDKTCVDIIASLGDSDSAGDIYGITPLRQLTRNYWTVYKVIYGLAMVTHIVFMSFLSIRSVNVVRYSMETSSNLTSYDNLTDFIKNEEARSKYHISILIYPSIMALFEIFYIGSQIRFYCKELSVTQIRRKEKQKDHRYCNALYKTKNTVETIGLLYFDALPHLAGLILPLTLFIGYFYNTRSDPLQIYFIMAALAIGWLHVISFTRGFKLLHSYHILYQYIIIRDVFHFAFVFTFVLLAFSFANHLVFFAVPETREVFPSFFDSFFFTFNVMLEPSFVENQYVEAFRRAHINPIAIKMSYLVYITLSSVIFLNVLIAMMTSTYTSVQKKQQKLWRIFTHVQGLRRERKIPILHFLFKRAKKPSAHLYFEDISSPFYPESGRMMRRCMAVLHQYELGGKEKII